MGIVDEDIVTVRERSDIVAVASQFMQLKRVGRRWTGLCPFHGERTPSFSVNAEQGLWYCLAGETRVITWEGVREIRDLAGATHRVLTEKGQWVDAPFRSFGVQPLLRVTLTRNRQVKVLHATPEHRWFVRGSRRQRHERTTAELRSGDGLTWTFPPNRARLIKGLSPFGIAHGITYGDGSRFGPGVALDLHGEKDRQLLRWFPENRRYEMTRANGAAYTRILDLPLFFKERPSLDESASYLAGWLAGYIAADGHVAKDGTCSLNSARREDLEFVRLLCTRLGVGTYGITEQVRRGLGQEDSSLFRIHFINEDLDERFFLIDEHRERFAKAEKRWVRRGWVVRSVEPTDRVEEVFCATVPGTHSFALEDNILTGNCFGCQAKGDTIKLVQELQHLDFVGAVEWLAGHAGITLRYTDRDQGESRKRRTALTEILGRAVEWYHQRLLTGPDAGAARAYLRQRGFDGETVRRYRIGWAPDGWDLLARHLAIDSKVLADSGLGFVNRAGIQQDFFRGRVLFPIFDPQDNAIGFGGRILPGVDGPKYRNTAQTPLYDKSKVLYGLNWAKDPVVKADEVIVCEGYTDVIGFARVGVPRAVATCGTALTEEHVRLLKRFARRVVLAFDPDGAGEAAAERFYEWEQRHELEVTVADLPAGQDPGDLAGSDPERLRAAVADTRPFLGFRVARALGGGSTTTPEGRARTAEAALAVIREHPSELVRDQYLMQVSDHCQVDIERLRASLRTGARPAVRPPAAPRRVASGDRPETSALRLAVDGERSADMLPLLHEVLFSDERHALAFRALRDAGGDLHAAVDSADPGAAELLQRLAAEDDPGEPPDVRRQLLRLEGQREVERLRRRIRAAADPDAEAEALNPVIAWLLNRLDAVRLDARPEREVEDELLGWLAERAEERA
ncbi:MAG TPA: DNA primase [Acidimicrobiales bacterium]|nr:DNA primase [Acidimicrobiales bacterium]